MTTLRAGPEVRVGDLTLIPIESTTIQGTHVRGRVVAIASKSPAAIVVQSPSGVEALDPEGGRVSLGDLLRDVAGLRERLNG